MTSWPALRAALIGFGLVFVLTAPTLTHPTSVGRIDTNDGRFSIWNIGWIGHALVTDPSEVLNANIFYPYRGTLAYSELNLVAGLFGLPWFVATGSAMAALNGAIATALVLAFLCMWALVRRLSGSDAAGLVSATAFTFCPYVAARTPHVQLLMIFAFPLVMLSFHRLADRPDWRRGIELGFSLAVAALACGYYGIYGGLALGTMAVILGQRSRAYWAALGGAVLTAGALVGPVFYVFTTARAASGSTVLERGGEAARWSANLSAYLTSPSEAHAFWRAALAAWQPWTEVLFPGAGLLLLAIAGVWAVRHLPRDRAVTAAYLAVSTLAFWASFGPELGLYRVLETVVPGISLLRAPARLGIVVTFGLAVVAGFGARRVTGHGRWVAPLLVLAIAAELGVRTVEWGWPSWPLRTVPSLSAADRRLAALPRGVLVEYPFPYVRSNLHNHGLAMFWSTYHWLPMINGYSDVIPRDFEAIATQINGFPDDISFQIMRARDVRYVLVRIGRYDTASRRRLEERFRRYADYLHPIVRDDEAWLFQITGWPDAVASPGQSGEVGREPPAR
jgi:hypothetical protein